MELQGTIKLIRPEVKVGESFTKREFVLTTEGEHPQHILLELHKDKCSLLDAYFAGSKVKVSINIRGREWTNPQGETKYFNSIQAWRVENA